MNREGNTSGTTQAFIGISACLLGHEGRHSGGRSRDKFETDILDNICKRLSLCPEMGSGMPAPLATLRWVGEPAAPRLIGPRSGTDHIETMQEYAPRSLTFLRSQNLHGFIFKAKLPHCG